MLLSYLFHIENAFDNLINLIQRIADCDKDIAEIYLFIAFAILVVTITNIFVIWIVKAILGSERKRITKTHQLESFI